jgi:hypothetical protein
VFGGAFGTEALSIDANVLCAGACHASTEVIDTYAVDAALCVTTSFAWASGVAETFALVALLSCGACDTSARIADTLTIYTCLVGSTGDFLTGEAAFSIATKLSFSTADADTSIFDTLSFAADLIGTATSTWKAAVLWDTVAIATDFACGTSGVTCLFDTDPFDAFGGVITGADMSRWALVTGAVFAAFSTETCTCTGLFDIFWFVCLAVAVVVFSVADFLRGLGSGASRPVALYTSLGAFATRCLAGLGQAFVNFAITVIIFAITYFGGGTISSATNPLPFDTSGCFVLTTVVGFGAGFGQSVIDDAVAVIIFVVADFFAFGGRCATSTPGSFVADLGS